MNNSKLLKAAATVALIAAFTTSCKDTVEGVKRPTTQFNDNSPAAYNLPLSITNPDGHLEKIEINGAALYHKTSKEALKEALAQSDIELSKEEIKQYADTVEEFRLSLAHKYTKYREKLGYALKIETPHRDL